MSGNHDDEEQHILNTLEEWLRQQVRWWESGQQGFSEQFRIGTTNGLRHALTKLYELRELAVNADGEQSSDG